MESDLVLSPGGLWDVWSPGRGPRVFDRVSESAAVSVHGGWARSGGGRRVWTGGFGTAHPEPTARGAGEAGEVGMSATFRRSWSGQWGTEVQGLPL